MNLEKLANWGIKLVKEGQHSNAQDLIVKTSNDLQLLSNQANDLLKLSENEAISQRIHSADLLKLVSPLPELVDFNFRHKQFQQIYNLIFIFISSTQTWDEHFSAHFSKYEEFWNLTKEGLENLQEIQKKQFETEDKTKLYSIDLPSEENLSEKIPCNEPNENGLTCNQNDLVKLKSFPTFFTDNKKTDVSISRCAKCGQFYKEIVEIDESLQSSQTYFLKPNETNPKVSFYFSNSEVEELQAFLPEQIISKTQAVTELMPSFENEQQAKVIEEKYSLDKNISLEFFIRALLPAMQNYGVTHSRNETYLRKNDEGMITNRVEIIGNQSNSHLKYDFSYVYGDEGSTGSERLQGFNLFHLVTGKKLDLSFEVRLLSNNPQNNIYIYLDGEENEVERLNGIIKSVIQNN